MHNDVLCAPDGFESALYYVLARLSEHLDGDVFGNESALYERTEKGILRFGRGGEADFDLLEAYIGEQFEKFKLCVEGHGLDEALVAVAEVDRAPCRRRSYDRFERPVHTSLRGKKKLGRVLAVIFHDNTICLSAHRNARKTGRSLLLKRRRPVRGTTLLRDNKSPHGCKYTPSVIRRKTVPDYFIFTRSARRRVQRDASAVFHLPTALWISEMLFYCSASTHYSIKLIK